MRLFHRNQVMQAHKHGESKAEFRNGFRKNHQQTPPHKGPATKLSPTVTSV